MKKLYTKHTYKQYIERYNNVHATDDTRSRMKKGAKKRFPTEYTESDFLPKSCCDCDRLENMREQIKNYKMVLELILQMDNIADIKKAIKGEN